MALVRTLRASSPQERCYAARGCQAVRMGRVMQYGLFDAPPERSDPLASDHWLDGVPDGDAGFGGARWYQVEAFEAIVKSLSTARSCLSVLATGLGKTVIASMLAKNWDGRVLFLAHRDELCDQARGALEAITGEYVDLEKAEYYAGNSRIVVGSTATMWKRKERFGADHFGLIIPDEAHRYLSPTFRGTVDYFTGAKVAGITATPDRGDEQALGQLFDEIAYVMDITDGIQSGYLVPVRAQRVVLGEIELDGVSKSGDDLVAAQLDEAMVKAVEGIVAKTLELEPNRQGIFFGPGVKTAEYFAQKMNQARPNSCAFVSGMTDPLERKRLVADYRAGVYRYMANCAVFTEGFDAPTTDLIIMGRPTLSRSLYAQCAGRGTRVLPGVVDDSPWKAADAERRAAILASAKPDCMILDFVGNSKHNLASPEDVLGGSYTPAEVAQAKEFTAKEPGSNVASNLLQARRVLQALASKVRATKIEAEVRPYDPFHALGVKVTDSERYANSFGKRPATEGQVAALRTAGVPNDELKGMSKRAAGKLLDALGERRSAGLATYKQMRQLRRFGVEQSDITFERASAAMNYITQKNWGRNGDISKDALLEILSHNTRAP